MIKDAVLSFLISHFSLSITSHNAVAIRTPYEKLIATGSLLLRQPFDALTGEQHTS